MNRSLRRFAAVGLAAIAAGVVAPAARAQASDPFALGPAMTSRAFFSCNSVIVNSALVDSTGAATNQGHVVSNGSITLNGNARIDGNAVAGPGKQIKLNGPAVVTGTRTLAPAAEPCTLVDLDALKTALQSSNDNARIPRTSANRDPLSGTGRTELTLNGGETLTLPAGTYYLTRLTLNGASTLVATGAVRFLVAGSVDFNGRVNADAAPLSAAAIRIWTTATGVSLNGGSELRGFVYAPNAAATINGNARLTGGLFAKSVTLNGNGRVTRSGDDAPPTVTISEPVQNALVDLAAVRVRGVATDAEGAVSLKVNGVAVSVGANGAFETTRDLRAVTPPVVTAVATDSAGQTATASVTLATCAAAPAVALVAPAPGSLVGTRVVTLQGTCGNATRVTVDGVAATVSNGSFTLAGFDLGADGARPLRIVATSQDGCPGTTVTPVLNVDATAPVVTIASPAGGSCFAPGPRTFSGAFFEPHPAATGAVRIEVSPAGASPGAPPVVVGAAIDPSGGSWTATGVDLGAADGTAVVTVVATDALGHAARAASIYRIDATAPAVALFLDGVPMPGSGTGATPPPSATPALFGRAVAPRAQVTDGGASAPPAPTYTLDGQPWNGTTPIATEGLHVVVARATDCAGNEGAAHATFRVDTTPPSLAELTPADGASLTAAPASLTGRASEDLSSVDVNGVAAVVSGATFSLAPLPWREGSNDLAIALVDKAGNRATFTRHFAVRTLAPSIAIEEFGLPIRAGSVFARAVTPSFRSSDSAATIAATLNRAPFAPGTSISTTGAYTLAATASAAGLTSTASVSFRVDLTGAPSVAIDAPEEGAVVAGPNVAVSGTAGPSAVRVTVNGREASLASGSFTLADLALADGPAEIVAIAADAEGRTSAAIRSVVVRSGGPQVVLLSPAEGARTNRRKIDVSGVVLGGASSIPSGRVAFGTTSVPLDATGAFRALDVPLVAGANTITASAVDRQGRNGSGSVVVTADFDAPRVSFDVDGQALADGAVFPAAVTVTVDVRDDGGPFPSPVVRLNGADRAVSALPASISVSTPGGYVLSVVARDAAGNETRAERSFVVGGSACALTDVEPADGASVSAARVTIHGRAATARSVKVRVPQPSGPPQEFTALLADGTFAAGDVPLPVEGENTLTLVCVDATGAERTSVLRIVRLAETGGPVLTISTPANFAKTKEASVVVTGTVSDARATVLVSGAPAVLTPSGAGATFQSKPIALSEGPNVLVVRAWDAASRSREARVVVERDSTVPRVQIVSPPSGASVGPTNGAAVVDVRGFVDLSEEPNLLSVVARTAAGSVPAVVDPLTGAFVATGLVLDATSGASVAQTVAVTASDSLGQTSESTIDVRFDSAGPALRLTEPVGGAAFRASAASLAVAGEAIAAEGASVSVNGGGLDPSSLSWQPVAGDSRRRAPIATTASVPSTDGAFSVVVRVEQLDGRAATERRVLSRDATAPSLAETVPANAATGADANAPVLLLFSERVRTATLAGADGVTLTRLSSGEAVVTTSFALGSVIALVPGAPLAAGETYRLRVGTGVLDVAGNALTSATEISFTTAASASDRAPVLDTIPAAVCAPSLVVKGTAAAGALVRVRDGALVFTGTADAAGRFAVALPLSGNGFHHVHVTASARESGPESPAASALFRVDCSAPSVVSASLDRATGRATVLFSEPMSAVSITTSGSGAAVRVSDAEDASRAPQAVIASLASDGVTLTIDLGSLADAWWRSKSVRLEIGPPAADLEGNAMAGRFATVFFPGSGPGDLAGAFLAGEAYDDASGRPLGGVDARLFLSGSALPGAAANASAPAAATSSDGRGRYSFAGDVAAGRYALVLEKAGHTRVVRRLPLEPGRGAVPFDARLTPLAAASSGLLGTTGGTFAGPEGSALALDATSGVAGGDATVRLTPLSGQGLPEFLPLGWTPLAAANVAFWVAGVALPESATFANGAARLTLPLPANVPSGATLVAVRHDTASGLWLTLGPVERLAPENGVERSRIPLAGPGAVAVVVADEDEATRPPAPTSAAGSPLVGVAPPAALPALLGTLTLDPPVVSPTGRATARVVARAADGTTRFPSGLAVQAYLDERLVLAGGGEVYESPFTTDLVLYRPPMTAADLAGAPPATAGALAFRVSPSPKAAQVILETGFENVRLYAFPESLERGSVLGPAGGAVTSPDGVELSLPESALAERVVVGARLLSAAERAALPALANVEGFDTVAAVRVDLAGRTLARPATLRVPVPAGLSADAPNDPRVVLARLVEQPEDGRGAYSSLAARVSRTGSGTPERFVAAPEPNGSELPLDGLVAEGVYAILRARAPIGFAWGFVRAASGTGLSPSRVGATGLGVADVTRSGGLFAVPAPTAAGGALTARHPNLAETGTAALDALAPGAVQRKDVTILPKGPRVQRVQPLDGATNQPVGSAVLVTFDEALDPASVGTSSLRVELAGDDGQSTGVSFQGTVALSADKLSIVFTPARAFPPGRRILATFTGGVRDAGGAPYDGVIPYAWRFTTSIEVIFGGQVKPEKFHLEIPVNGVARVRADAGALPVVAAGATPWAVWTEVEGPVADPIRPTVPARSDGSLETTTGRLPDFPATIASRVWVHVLSPDGSEATSFRVGPFQTPDGRGFVAPPGEATTFTTSDGVEVSVPEGAFETARVVTTRPLPVPSLGVVPASGFEIPVAVSVAFEGEANASLQLRLPVATSAPVGALAFGGVAEDLGGQRRLVLREVGRVVAGPNGTKLVSTRAADVASASAGLRAKGAAVKTTAQDLDGALYRLSRSGDIGFLVASTVRLVAVSGVASDSNLSVVYNAALATVAFRRKETAWNGRFVLPAVDGEPFDVVRLDSATGWEVSRRSYGPVTGGDFANVGPEVPPGTPRLVDASPFALHALTAGIPTKGEIVQRLRLEIEAVIKDTKLLTVRHVAGLPLAANSVVDVYDRTSKTRVGPRRVESNGSFGEITLKVDDGDDVVVVVTPGDLEASRLASFVLDFDRPVTDKTIGAAAKLYDCGPAEAPACGSLTIPVRTEPDTKTDASPNPAAYRHMVHVAGSLVPGRAYRLVLEASFLMSGTAADEVRYPPASEAPVEFTFATRPVGDPVVGTSGTSLFGTSGATRDLARVGNLVLAAAVTGDLVAVDVSDPRAPKSFAVLSGGQQVRALAADTHNRLFFNDLSGLSWALQSVRLEDVHAATRTSACAGARAWAADLPCFSPVLGGTRVAIASSASTGYLLGEIAGTSSRLPSGMPTALEIVEKDDATPTAELRAFYAANAAPGAPAFGDLVPEADGRYAFSVRLDARSRRPEREASCSGEDAWDRFQRVTVDNVSTGESWSFDVEHTWSGGTGNGIRDISGIRARKGDRLRIRYNLQSLGYVAVLGHGVTIVDLNRGYRLTLPASSIGAAQCGRRLGAYGGSDLDFRSCGDPANAAGLSLTSAVAALGATADGRGATSRWLYTPVLRYGLAGAGAPPAAPANFNEGRFSCLLGSAPEAKIFRDVDTARDVAVFSKWREGRSDSSRRDLLFVAMGAAGVGVYDASDRGLPARIGRFGVRIQGSKPGDPPATHVVYRVQADEVRGLLFAGGLSDRDGKPFVDVFDISRATGEPDAGGDPRLVVSIPMAWDSRRLAIDPITGLVFLGTGGPDGLVAAPLSPLSATLAGVFGPRDGETDPDVRPASLFAPLGVPARLTAADDGDAGKRLVADRSLTPSFKVRMALPGGLGDVLTAKIQTLRADPGSRLLSRDDVGEAVGLPGGKGWPKRDVFVSLRRVGAATPTTPTDPTGGSGRLSEAFNLYESDETIVLVADPRAAAAYRDTLQDAGDPSDEKTQCRRCTLPAWLAAVPSAKRAEVLAGGPVVRAFLAEDPSGSAAAAAATRAALELFGRTAASWPAPVATANLTGWADSVPAPAQRSLAEPARNAATLPFEAGASLSLANGDAILAQIDHATRGRSLGFAFDRTHRSGTLGYGALGSAGWHSSLFSHLRIVPVLEGDETEPNGRLVEWRDGDGNLWDFVPPTRVPSESGTAVSRCADGTTPSGSSYCPPKGLAAELAKDGAEWVLTTPTHERLRFAADGALVEIADRHRRDPKAAEPKGSALRIVTDALRRPVAAEDDLGRNYRFRYVEDPASKKYGLLKEIEDFAGRTVSYDFDDDRRLQEVQLPRVTLASGEERPKLTFRYAATPAGATAPLHGDLGSGRLEAYRLPGSTADRVAFAFDAATARVREFKVPVQTTWGIAYAPSAANLPASVKVMTPWQQEIEYTLGNGRITNVRRTQDVFDGTGPVPVPQAVVTGFGFDAVGRLTAVDRADGSRQELTYPTEGSPLVQERVITATTKAGNAPVGAATYAQITESAAYSEDNLPARLLDGENRATVLPVAEAGKANVASGFPSDDVSFSTTFDSFGRPSVTTSAGASPTKSEVKYRKDARGREGAGFAERVTSGDLVRTFECDENGNVERSRASHGVFDTATYDEWDRPKEIVLGDSDGALSPVRAKVRVEYDAAGHVVKEVRSQKDVGDVETRFVYDERERVVSITREKLAGESAEAGATRAGTSTFTYDPTSGLLAEARSAAGVVTRLEYDDAGRVSGVTRGAAGKRRTGYDALSRVAYLTDGDAAVWRGKYDAWGRLFEATLPTGAKVERRFDRASAPTNERLRASAGATLAETSTEFNSFGAPKRVEETLRTTDTGTETSTTVLTYDPAARLDKVTTNGRLEIGLGYEKDTSRVKTVSDATGTETLTYPTGSPLPNVIETVQAAGNCGGGVPSVSIERTYDAFARTTDERRSDGAHTTYSYDEAGNPLSVASSAGWSTSYAWDGDGKLVSVTRPAGQGATAYGYDLDGRVKKRQTIAGASPFVDTFDYDDAGRVVKRTHPDGTHEDWAYNPDDTVSRHTRRDGVVVDFTYDPANRLLTRVPTSGASVVRDGGQSFAWDEASRLLGTTRLLSNTTSPNDATKIVFGDYDLAGRARTETVGARPPLTRAYDGFSRVTSLSLPAGVGTGSTLTYERAYQGCSDRLSTLTATGGGALTSSLGATWAWWGKDKPLGITTRSALRTAHRFGYVGGPGAQLPSGPDDPAAPIGNLATLGFGTAGSTDPLADAGIVLGTSGGSRLWGQLSYGYRAGDAAKLGRLVAVNPLGLLQNQGHSYGLDASRRLTRLTLGAGSLIGLDASSPGAVFERFRYGYGPADQLLSRLKELSGEGDTFESGPDGRPTSRTTNGLTSAIAHDGEGRRTSDARYDYVWHWHGKLARVTVKTGWGSPYEGHQVRFAYDASGRLFSATQYGPLPQGQTDDLGDATARPFVETREHLWDRNQLLGEVGKAADGAIRWRYTYVPGAEGMDDQVQLRVETYGASNQLQSEKLYAYLRDDMGSVLGLVDEESPDAAKPRVPVRFLYDAFGRPHAETSLEIGRVRYDDVPPALESGPVLQSPAANAVAGAMTLSFRTPVDATTIPTGVLLERRGADGVWAALAASGVAAGRRQGSPEDVVLVPLSGFEKGASYRVRATSTLRDQLGRGVSTSTAAATDFQIDVPATPTGGVGSTTGVIFDRTFTASFDSQSAANTTLGGILPGGQPLLFQGQYVHPVLGLHIVRNRVFDPETQSWLSEDPEDDVDSPNLYAFVGQEPHEGRDPLGLATLTPLGNLPPTGDTAAPIAYPIPAESTSERVQRCLAGGCEFDPLQEAVDENFRIESWYAARDREERLVVQVNALLGLAGSSFGLGPRNQRVVVRGRPSGRRVAGETPATRLGREQHAERAASRRQTGSWSLVNEPIPDESGKPVTVPRYVDLRSGQPVVAKGTQKAVPDAVNFELRLVLDDKPVARSIVKDRQQMIRYIKAYIVAKGEAPKTIAVERYDPATGKPVRTDLYEAKDFMPWVGGE